MDVDGAGAAAPAAPSSGDAAAAAGSAAAAPAAAQALSLTAVEGQAGGAAAPGGQPGEAKPEGLSHLASLSEVPAGAYRQREQYLAQQEALGELSFHYVRNNGTPENSRRLLQLKHIFSKQLPNMPREYIVKLVMDRRHRSVAIEKRGGLVLGGITYRPFVSQGFGEIAFCAVMAHQQVKGYGTRLMNYTKEYAKTMDQLGYFLTYADNAAIGYFTKQGFTRTLTLPTSRWKHYIKDYDGTTLMECLIYRELPYTHFPQLITAQRAALDRRIRGVSQCHVVHPGLTCFAEGRRIDLPAIPGLLEAKWEPTPEAPRYQVLLAGLPHAPTRENCTLLMQDLLTTLQRHEDSWPFREPVDGAEVLDYYDIIKDPIDLATVQRRLAAGSYYIVLDIFAADLRRISANARLYNAADTIYYKLADRLEAFVAEYFAAHLLPAA